ncbi:hypothetical protein BDV12DRAFT_164908 [Aspergillus spectabilis]
MGANHRVKTKYVFRLALPLPFLKSKRMNVKGNGVDGTYEGFEAEDSIYASVPQAIHVDYESEADSDIESDEDVDPLDINVPTAAVQRQRLVSWDGVRDQVRTKWTVEQEEKLVHARAELARCQKAWSSEQDIWLKCVDILNEEKAAHESFLNNRSRHIGDEQNHFRKVWNRNRRRSEQDRLQGQSKAEPQCLTQAQRTKSLPVRLRLPGRI